MTNRRRTEKDKTNGSGLTFYTRGKILKRSVDSNFFSFFFFFKQNFVKEILSEKREPFPSEL